MGGLEGLGSEEPLQAKLATHLAPEMDDMVVAPQGGNTMENLAAMVQSMMPEAIKVDEVIETQGAEKIEEGILNVRPNVNDVLDTRARDQGTREKKKQTDDWQDRNAKKGGKGKKKEKSNGDEN